MMKKKVFFSISLIAAVGFCMTASAQNDSTKQTRWQRIDQKLKENYAKVNYDTEYIGRPDLLWTVKLKGNIGGSLFNNYGKYAGESMRGKLKSDDMRTIGVEVGYSGLSLGFSINPTSNSKKYKDEEYTMNYYDNHFGFDVEYQHIKSFHGNWAKLSNGYYMNRSHLKYKAKTTTDVNYRKGPGTKYKKYGTYKPGTIVTIVQVKNGWARMSNGKSLSVREQRNGVTSSSLSNSTNLRHVALMPKVLCSMRLKCS